MTYFAIGESDGGAGERRLGPFNTPDEAEAAGKRETKDSNGAFVLKGVVDEANNQVFVDVEPVVSTNAVVRNAVAANRRVARNASGNDKTRFFADLDKIKAKLASGFGDIEDLLYAAEHGEYDGYEAAAMKARAYNDMANKLWSDLSRR